MLVFEPDIQKTYYLLIQSLNDQWSITLYFICAQHCWSTLSTRECLQSAHTSKNHSDSMEMCWFSENNGVIRLSFALLTRACWLWRLETCWHKHLIGLFPPSNLLFAPYFLQGYETTVHFWAIQHLLQALGFVIMIVQVKLALSYNEGKYYAHKGACNISEARIKHVETKWEKNGNAKSTLSVLHGKGSLLWLSIKHKQ